MKEDADQLTNADTENLRELIDEALDHLPDEDRKAVFLRFFEGREFAEIGTRLGKSGGAAQKQIRRALQSLGGILQNKGLSISAVALGAFLTPELTTAASVSVAKIASAATTSAGASTLTSTLQIMASAKSLTLTGIVLVAALIPLGLQGSRIAEKKQTLTGGGAGIKTRIIETVPVPTNSKAMATGKVKPREPLTASSLVAAFLRSTYEFPSLFSEGPSLHEFKGELQWKSAEEIQSLLAELDAMNISGEVHWNLRELLVRDYLSMSDPKDALDQAIKHGMKGESFQAIMLRWSRADFESAYAWLQEQREAGNLLRRRLDGKDPETALLEGFGEGLAAADLEGAFTFVQKNIDSPDATSFVKGIGRKLSGEYIGKMVGAAIHQKPAPDSDASARLIELAKRLPQSADQSAALRDYATQLANSPMVGVAIDATRDLLDHAGFPPEMRNGTLLGSVDGLEDDNGDYGFMIVHELSTDEQRAQNLIDLAHLFEKSHPRAFGWEVFIRGSRKCGCCAKKVFEL